MAKSRKFENVDQWIAGNGGRPMVATPSTKWLRGPFYFPITMPAAGAELNLLATTIINADPQVQAAYNSSTVPKAILRIEAVRVLSFDALLRTAVPADKSILSRLSLRAKVGTNTERWPIGQTLEEMWNDVISASAEVGYKMGTGPYQLPHPFEIDLEEDDFAVEQFATTAGVGFSFLMEVQGWMFQNGDTRDSRLSGASKGVCPRAAGLGGLELIDALAARSTIVSSTKQVQASKG